jgi:predicted transposase/invertase (TIGR01784 family)
MNPEKLDDRPLAVQGRVFERLFHIARIDKLNREEMETYNKSVLEYDDVMDAVQYATISGEKRGERRGEKRGKKEALMVFAVKLNTKGTPITEISELTELSLEELQNILGEC